MISPMMIPIMYGSRTESKCPSCDKVEEIINVCKHCGYKYIEPSHAKEIIGIIAVFAILAVFITHIMGFFDGYKENPHTFMDGTRDGHGSYVQYCQDVWKQTKYNLTWYKRYKFK